METQSRGPALRAALCGTTAILAAIIFTPVFAQEAEPAKSDDIQTVVVTGYRASLQSALTTKRNSEDMVDAINAEDIADFPDANLAESLQRIPGISIDRDNGEGRTITVRGLGGDFTRVRINDLEALSTAGTNDTNSTAMNTTRTFDFNVFASELFNSLKVRKTASAETDEGSLGATVDLQTGRPFDYKKDRYAFAIENAYYDNGGYNNPRITGLLSKRWAGGRLGFLASVAYSEKDSENDQYRRQIVTGEYVYRSTTWATLENPRRSGFSAPAGTTFGSSLTAAGVVQPTTPSITNAAYIAAVTGSDPTAYAILHPAAADGTIDGSKVIFPALAGPEQQDLHQERLGLTSSFQMQISSKTRATIDLLYSKQNSTSTLNQLLPFGLNRNNTNNTYAKASATTALASKRGLYPGTCTYTAGGAYASPIDCGQALYGNTLVAGTNFSYNPYNLDVYDYYNSPTSVGYVASADGLAVRDKQIGRPATDVLAAHVTNGVADYLQLRNVDWSARADQGSYETTFQQVSFNLTHEFTDKLKGDFTYGASKSYLDSTGKMAEWGLYDQSATFTYDERGGGDMPLFDAGFNAADPTQWTILKGVSFLRHHKKFVENRYGAWKADFEYAFNDNLNFKFGGTGRDYSFSTAQYERQNVQINPTEKEAGVTIASLGKVINFGQGLDVPAGSTTAWFGPDIDKFDALFGFTCNCINKWGDWRLTQFRQQGRETFDVTEKTGGVYAQASFNYDFFDGWNAFGNLGVRYATTDIVSNGRSTGGRNVQGTNSYSDTLPSFNIAIRPRDNLYFRFGAAKTMSRPTLQQLAPTITALSIPSDGNSSGATLTIGNPKLSPFRANNYDASVEWYYAKGGLISVAVFKKEIGSYPQTVRFSGPLSTFLDAAGRQSLIEQYGATSAEAAYITNDYPATARQFRDAPGGELKGIEINYQQAFTFLPGLLRNTGIQLNATHIDSELTYILDPGSDTTPQVTGKGPWLGASPNAVNLTVYYEDEKINARISMAQRDGYYTTYPVVAGSCAAGVVNGVACDTPLINDFGGSEDTLNVDFALSYNLSKRLSVSLEGLNMTNQTTNRYYYSDQPVTALYGSTGRQFTVGLRYRM
ncbi:TonB-dependent receptor [Asticcacaulis sp. YBE204]|uniref:TonB-dependent receptor n=1 Tax=Asticcacaulis sp. YBE204 TaxID=1282363 RepID=UPI0003C40BB4|nr:TonB-dependent receptor [Asticcacaulis sp. YBE204]ESQ78349.1 TonB-denpendent receptor [Asticcacaulis sp. YBE204]